MRPQTQYSVRFDLQSQARLKSKVFLSERNKTAYGRDKALRQSTQPQYPSRLISDSRILTTAAGDAEPGTCFLDRLFFQSLVCIQSVECSTAVPSLEHLLRNSVRDFLHVFENQNGHLIPPGPSAIFCVTRKKPIQLS